MNVLSRTDTSQNHECVYVADVWLGFSICYQTLDFEFALGGALGGFWDAGLGLEILLKTIAFTSLNLNPIGLT